MSAHTKGPWQVGRDQKSEHLCEVMTAAFAERPGLHPTHKLICRTWAPDTEPLASFIGFSRGECLANARLIAAAPELLEALQAAIDSGLVPLSSAKDGGATRHARQVLVADQIRAAIAKATGEAAP